MARRLRLESETGIYHVINRGNYKSPVFRSERTKQAFLKCLGEACDRVGWIVHAWAIMSNHYHLALATPRANLSEGMCWLQGTFATRFNRFRQEHGHIFQGRYKGLVVDPIDGLGPLCHYIHLNPVRAQICRTADLAHYRWTSFHWLFQPALRPPWFQPAPALYHAGGLLDHGEGHRCYLAYLDWLAEDQPAQKRMRFDGMSRGWIIGPDDLAKAIALEHRELAGHGPRLAIELQTARESIWTEKLDQVLHDLRRQRGDIPSSGKSADWKLAAAARMKALTTATNRWLAHQLQMGNQHEVSRKVNAWVRASSAVQD